MLEGNFIHDQLIYIMHNFTVENVDGRFKVIGFEK